MRITDRLIKNKEFYHHMKESLEDINYIFKNGRDELKGTCRQTYRKCH